MLKTRNQAEGSEVACAGERRDASKVEAHLEEDKVQVGLDSALVRHTDLHTTGLLWECSGGVGTRVGMRVWQKSEGWGDVRGDDKRGGQAGCHTQR